MVLKLYRMIFNVKAIIPCIPRNDKQALCLSIHSCRNAKWL